MRVKKRSKRLSGSIFYPDCFRSPLLFFGGTRGDCRMETIDTLREAINSVFAEWEKLPRIPSDWQIVGVQDIQHDRYTLQHISFAKDRYDTRLLAYLEIRDGKI